MKIQKTGADLEKIVKVKMLVEKLVKSKFKVSYKHSISTNTYYIRLSNCEGVYYDLRFSDHKSKNKKIKTFYFNNNRKEDLEKFIKDGIRKMETKQVRYLFEKIA
jgi:hypothetical protein